MSENLLMKEKLLKIFFKKELCEIEDKYCQKILEYENENKLIKLQSHEESKVVDNIFQLLPNSVIIVVGRNKSGIKLFSILDNNSILLYGGRYKSSSLLPRINFLINCKEVGNISKRYIKIVDIIMIDRNIGNGTQAMKALIKYAKNNDIDWIEGEISIVDIDHIDYLINFYKKFGFKINGMNIILELLNVRDY